MLVTSHTVLHNVTQRRKQHPFVSQRSKSPSIRSASTLRTTPVSSRPLHQRHSFSQSFGQYACNSIRRQYPFLVPILLMKDLHPVDWPVRCDGSSIHPLTVAYDASILSPIPPAIRSSTKQSASTFANNTSIGSRIIPSPQRTIAARSSASRLASTLFAHTFLFQ